MDKVRRDTKESILQVHKVSDYRQVLGQELYEMQNTRTRNCYHNV